MKALILYRHIASIYCVAAEMWRYHCQSGCINTVRLASVTYLPILLVVSGVVIIRTLYTYFDLLWSGCMNYTALLNSSGSFSRYEVHFCTVNDQCRVSCLFTQSCRLLLRRYNETVAFAPLNSPLNIKYKYIHGTTICMHMMGGFSLLWVHEAVRL